MINNMFSQINLLKNSIRAASMRKDAIADNISNAETPGYKRKEVVFEEELKQVLLDNNTKLRTTNEKHVKGFSLNNIEPEVKISDTKMRQDGNGVDIEKEIIEMTRNTMKYNFLIEKITRDLRRVKNVVNEGR